VGALRLSLPRSFADKHGRFVKTGTEADYKFLWSRTSHVRVDEEARCWNAAHHPFYLAARRRHQGRALTNAKVLFARWRTTLCYGTELGSGSIRIHRQDVQAEIFRSLGMSDAEARSGSGSSWML